nr:hypothetical protein GCM10020093_093300 [Planobispora longispora]
MQVGAAHDLHVEVAHAQHPAGCLTDGGEGFGKQIVEGLAVGVALLVLVGERAQLGVGQAREVVLDGVDLVGDPLELTQKLAFACAKNLVEKGWHFR